MSSKAHQYRQRARACLEIARTFAPGQKRTILTDMAQTWLQLAEGLERADQSVMQQQQVQPKDDDKKEYWSAVWQ